MLSQLDELSNTYSLKHHLEPAEYAALGLTSLQAILVELWPFEDRGCMVASDANPGPPSVVPAKWFWPFGFEQPAHRRQLQHSCEQLLLRRAEAAST